ncbi:MAG: hypothetical protein P1P84_12915 [Deferrisomatales bacterium]|nr:hypothetical protein [Deferrisomatales bacterium]
MRRSVFGRRSQRMHGAGVVALSMTLALGASAGSAHAKVFGYGNKGCMEYIEVFDNREGRSLYASWAQGYFSSISQREGLSDFTRGIGDDPNAMQKWLKRYCERRNSKRFYEAVDAYAEELIKAGAQ